MLPVLDQENTFGNRVSRCSFWYKLKVSRHITTLTGTEDTAGCWQAARLHQLSLCRFITFIDQDGAVEQTSLLRYTVLAAELPRGGRSISEGEVQWEEEEAKRSLHPLQCRKKEQHLQMTTHTIHILLNKLCRRSKSSGIILDDTADRM